MRLSARSEYGLLAAIDLAERHGDGPVSSRGVASRKEIPARFLDQLFAALRRHGVVKAVRGARGGFVLARDPSAITVLEVVEALEGPLEPSVCSGGSPCAKSGSCAALGVWDRATVALRDVFAATTLDELARRQVDLDSAPHGSEASHHGK